MQTNNQTDTGRSGGGAAYRVTKVARSLLSAYSQIYFSTRVVTGLLFVAATFVVPRHGAAGLSGMLLSNLWARLLGRPDDHIEDGYYGFNGLLVGLALGLYYRYSLQFALLLLVSTFLTVIIAAVMRSLSERYIGVPVLSLPFVWVTWIALLAARRFSAVELTIDTVLVSGWGGGYLPVIVELYVRSLGAAFFQLSVLSGGLVFLGLLWFSRWAVILSVIGFASGYATYAALGGTATDLTAEFVGFNFILTAIALGGVFIILRPESMLLAAAAASLSALLSAALLAFLQPFGLPVVAMPFIAATQLVLLTLLFRTSGGKLETNVTELDSPEKNLTRSLYRKRRYPDPSVPVVFVPVMGRWVVTQGPGGELTHKGLWSHAWDFEVHDEEGRTHRNAGNAREDYLAYRAPVLAPADGRVVRVVNHLDDNPIGEVDTKSNWGNLVIIWHFGDVFSTMCHLLKQSVTVKEGDLVTAGQPIAKVGNSGRSPVPHLHFHLQRSGEIGAPTTHSELLHYIEIGQKREDYITHGVPQKGQVISRMDVSDTARRAVTLAPGRSWRFRIREGNSERIETWLSEIDPVGNRKLRVDGCRIEASFFADNHYTTMLDFTGSRRSLLGLFYLGAPRVPYLESDKIPWSDTPAVSPFLPGPKRLIHEMALPFVEVGRLKTRSTMTRNAHTVTVSTRIARNAFFSNNGSVPDRIEVVFTVGEGPTSLRCFRGDLETLKAELVV